MRFYPGDRLAWIGESALFLFIEKERVSVDAQYKHAAGRRHQSCLFHLVFVLFKDFADHPGGVFKEASAGAVLNLYSHDIISKSR